MGGVSSFTGNKVLGYLPLFPKPVLHFFCACACNYSDMFTSMYNNLFVQGLKISGCFFELTLLVFLTLLAVAYFTCLHSGAVPRKMFRASRHLATMSVLVGNRVSRLFEFCLRCIAPGASENPIFCRLLDYLFGFCLRLD